LDTGDTSLLQCLGQLTPAAVHGTVKRVSAFGLFLKCDCECRFICICAWSGLKLLGQQQQPCQAVNQTQTWWMHLLHYCRIAHLESAAYWPQNHHGHSCF